MARTRTLTLLETECYERCDVRAITVPQAEMWRMINGSLADLYDQVCKVNKSQLMAATAKAIAVVSGTASYALDDTHYRTVGVDVTSGGAWYPMRRFNWSERNIGSAESNSNPLSTSYRVQGTKIWFAPTPAWSGTARVWYIPAPPILAAGTTTWDGIAGWEEYAVLDTIIKIKSKLEEDAQLEMAQKKACLERILAVAADMDDGEPPHVRDVELEGP